MIARIGGTVAALLCFADNAAVSQDITQLAARIDAVKQGMVRLSFAARDGVCGNGSNWTRTPAGVVNSMYRNRDVEVSCDRGPIRVVVVRDGGVTTELRVYVGAQWKPDSSAIDIGTVSAGVAGRWLLSQVGETDPHPARAALTAATLADSVDAWPALLRIARNERLPTDVRSQAVYWLSESAGERVTASLDSIAYEPGDRDVRRQAIYAMSRRPVDEAVPNLLRMAETLRDRELRRLAVYWLGRTRDVRAVEYFEKVLAAR